MDDLLKNKLTCNYDEINQLELPFNKQVILEVLKDDVKYEFLLNLKADSKKLLVFNSGARNIKETPEEKSKPHFQRTFWNFEESIIYVNDPTTYKSNELWAGWGIGDKDNWYLENIARIIEQISELLNIENKRILFYGSTVGGFMSMVLSTLIKDSASVIESPHFDLTTWSFAWRNVEQYCFNGLSNEEINNLSYRYDIIDLIKKENYFPNAYIILNCAKDYEFTHFYVPFFNRLNQLPYSEEKNKIRFRLDSKDENDPPLTFQEIKNIFNNVYFINDESIVSQNESEEIYNTCRIDIKNYGSKDNNIEIFDVNTSRYTLLYPHWMENNEGKGALIHSDANKLNFKIKCVGDGKLNLILKGLFFNDASSKRIPIYIDITKLVINEETILDSSNLVYHDRYLTYVKKVEDGEIVDVEVEWVPLNKQSKLITNTVIKHANVLEEEKNLVKEKKASITIQNIGNIYNGIVVLDSPEEAIVSKPTTVEEKDGTEINITSKNNEIMLSLMFIEDGEFNFKLNEILNNELWDEKSSYKTLIINDEIIFTSDDSLNEYEYKKEIKNAEKMDIMVEWS